MGVQNNQKIIGHKKEILLVQPKNCMRTMKSLERFVLLVPASAASWTNATLRSTWPLGADVLRLSHRDYLTDLAGEPVVDYVFDSCNLIFDDRGHALSFFLCFHDCFVHWIIY